MGQTGEHGRAHNRVYAEIKCRRAKGTKGKLYGDLIVAIDF